VKEGDNSINQMHSNLELFTLGHKGMTVIVYIYLRSQKQIGLSTLRLVIYIIHINGFLLTGYFKKEYSGYWFTYITTFSFRSMSLS